MTVIATLINKLPFAKQPWFIYLKVLCHQFIKDDCPQKAASLTYTTLLSIVPILTVMLAVFSSVPALSEMREQLQTTIYNNLLPSSGAQISHYFDSFAEKSKNLGIIGVIGLFVTTIMTLITIETTFNRIWRTKERSVGAANIIRYWALITLGPVVLGVAFGASSAISSADFLNRQIAGYGIDWSVWAYIASVLFTTTGFVGMYWFIPQVKVPFKNAAIAGVVSAVLFEILRTIFGTVMSNFTSYEAIYGAFAALPIFLLWIYLSWNIILLGVEISHTLTLFDAKTTPTRHPFISLLTMLNLIHTHHQQGKTVSEQALRAVLSRKEMLNWSVYIEQLVHANLIAHTKDNDYLLKTDLNSVSLWQLYQILPYPLPIKGELHELTQHADSPWLSTINKQFDHIEHTTKHKLNISLADLFNGVPVHQTDIITSGNPTDHLPPHQASSATPNTNTPTTWLGKIRHLLNK